MEEKEGEATLLGPPEEKRSTLKPVLPLLLFFAACAGPSVPIPSPTIPTLESATPPTAPRPTRAPPTPTSPATPRPNPPAVPEATARPSARGYLECSQGPTVCRDDLEDWLARIEVPPGFAVSSAGRLPEGTAPTSITYGPDGRLYVATIPQPFEDGFLGAVYVVEAGGEASVYADGFLIPAGLAFEPRGRRLYVSSRAGRYEGKISVVDPDGTVRDLVAGLPCCFTLTEHQPNGLAFGPDGMLYLAIGARSDHGEIPWSEEPGSVHPLEAGILRMEPDGRNPQRYSQGLRNPYDLDFDLSGRLWAADNGPDFGPPDRLYLIEEGAHYGFPYYEPENCLGCLPVPPGLVVSPPYVEFPAHSVPAGLAVYKGERFPLNYVNSVLVTLWNPGPGGKVVRVYDDRRMGDFITGLWAPVDIVNTPDGSVVVADYLSGRLFKIRWEGR